MLTEAALGSRPKSDFLPVSGFPDLPRIEDRVVVLDKNHADWAPKPYDLVISLNGREETHIRFTDRSSTSYMRSEWRLGRILGSHPPLTNQVLRLVGNFWTIVLSKALQSGLHANGAVDIERDSEERISQTVLRIYLDATAKQALSFWDGLEADLGRWMEHLDVRNRQTVIRDIALRIHWNVD